MTTIYRNTKIILSRDQFGRITYSTIFADGRFGLSERLRLGTEYHTAVDTAKAYIDRVLS
jgi:hypothetical protein